MGSIIDLVIAIFSTAISSYVLLFTQRFITVKKNSDEENEIANEVKKVYTSFEGAKDDVLSLMIKNVAELREYYTMNKQQARNSFSAALFTCVLGFLLFVAGVAISYINTGYSSVIPYTTIAGSVVEIIAGLFFWLYSKAIKQINIFHSSLQNTEKFLTAIQLVEKISPEKKDDIYSQIISKILSSNFEVKES